MVRILRGLAEKYFSDDEAVILFLLLVAGTAFILLFGAMLAPVIAALIVAFILQGLVTRLVNMRVPELVAIIGVFIVFLGVLVGFLFGLLPLIWSQVTSLAGRCLASSGKPSPTWSCFRNSTRTSFPWRR